MVGPSSTTGAAQAPPGHPSPHHHESGPSHSQAASMVDSFKASVELSVQAPRTPPVTLLDELNAAAVDGDSPQRTLYDLINKLSCTSKFARLLDKHPDVMRLLSSTNAYCTLFVPIDSAFDHGPDYHEEPGKGFVESMLYYHVGLGKLRAAAISFTSHTIPTALNERYLGGQAQRLRTNTGPTGVYVNFCNRVVAVDIEAKNGILHAVDTVLIPPPTVGQVLELFPVRFSTLLLAYVRTDFVRFIHGVKMTGSTVFAPSNDAFAALGLRANAFLNTELGRKCLLALLKYHISPDTTLYSDAIYDKAESREPGPVNMLGRVHHDLPTLLGDARVGVDIARLPGFMTMEVNGQSRVSVQNSIAKNGVIHIVDKVLLPPSSHKVSRASSHGGGIDVEDFKEILKPYLTAI